MNCLADYAARTIAMVVAVGIPALTIFIHAADRTQLGAPVATAVAQSQDSRPSTNAQAAPAAVALAAHHPALSGNELWARPSRERARHRLRNPYHRRHFVVQPK